MSSLSVYDSLKQILVHNAITTTTVKDSIRPLVPLLSSAKTMVPALTTALLRADSWRILLDYIPDDLTRHHVLKLKRNKYRSWVERHMGERDIDHTILDQIKVDVIRTRPTGYDVMFKQPAVQKMLQTLLYVSACENKEIHYFQGMGDLASIFVIVFARTYGDLTYFNSPNVPYDDRCFEVEADTYWCLKSLLKNYKYFAHNLFEGIQPALAAMRGILSIANPHLLQWADRNQLDFSHFAFRWMLLLLVRELPIDRVIQLWDNYFSEGSFSQFHVFVCTSFFLRWASALQKLDFTDGLLLLQHLPTNDWAYQDVDTVIVGARNLSNLHQKYTLLIPLVTAAIAAVILCLLYVIFGLFMMCLSFLKEVSDRK